MACVSCIFTYHVVLPAAEALPPDPCAIALSNLFQVVFFCNGRTFTSQIFNDPANALTWAQDVLGSYGTWTLVGNDLIVTESMCSTGSLYYRPLLSEDVVGCMDESAINWNYLATIDDGSCVYLPTPVLGCTNPVATNYDPLANEDDGSCVFASNSVVFDTASQKLVETKIGSNIFETDVSQFALWIPNSQEIAFQIYYYTPIRGSGVMDEGTATLVNNFLSAVGVSMGIIYWIREDSIVAAFPTYLDWLVARFNPEFIQLDQEALSVPGLTNAIYIARSRQVQAHIPLIPLSWDTGLIYRNNADTISRNTALSTEAAPPDIGRQYHQVSPDRITVDPVDQDYNLILLNNYFNNMLPADRALFFATLPNLTQQSIAQWQNNDAYTTQLSVPLNNWAIGRMAEYILSNTEFFAYLIFMQHSSLVAKTPPKPPFTSVKRIVPAFKFQWTMPVSIPITGCTGVAFWDGANGFALLINNQTSVETIILAADIVIPTKIVAGNFIRDSGFADTWTSTQQNEIVSEPNITVRKYSVNMITFTAI